MKDAIKGLIDKGCLSEYTKDKKRDNENSSKRKSLSKEVDAVTGGKEASNEEEEAHKGNHQHIMVIIGGAPHENSISKRTMKTEIAKLMTIK